MSWIKPATLDSPFVRRLRREDLQAVFALQKSAGVEDLWTFEQFTKLFSISCMFGFVVVCDKQVCGYAICEMRNRCNKLIHIAVHSECKRHGFGRILIHRLQDRLGPRTRDVLWSEVRESDVGYQLFLKSVWFRYERSAVEGFLDPPEARYVFVWRRGAEHAKSGVGVRSLAGE